jgi:hypothetical protein
MQRGLSAEEATALIVNGFVKDVLQQLPMEFAVEAQKLISIRAWDERTAMTEAEVADRLLEEIQALRSDIVHLGSEVASLRFEVSRLTASQADDAETPQAALCRLWDEGLASGDAGDVDDVFDELLAGLPDTPHRI